MLKLFSMTSLDKLREYASSSEEDSSSGLKTISPENKRTKLPLPDVICSLSDPTNTEYNNDPSKHQCRIRSFDHVKGNWATFLYIPYPEEFSEELKINVFDLFQFSGIDGWNVVDSFHMSISRTSAIPHHYIEPLVDAIKDSVRTFNTLDLMFSSKLKFYVNDEKTRSFCGFQISCPLLITKLQYYVDRINQPLKDYGCDGYYSNPSFHISIAWTLGNIFDQNWKMLLHKFQIHWLEVFTNCPELFSFKANCLACKCGNRLFKFEFLKMDSKTVY
uniref:U6 snRNA phosphodiesterase n=1 Tax=Ciona savignyi TaxID=51511 RepID=H2Y8C0_CIOSA